MTMPHSQVCLPEFSRIRIEDIEAQLDALLAANRQQLQALKQQTSPTWASFAQPIQAMDVALDDFWAPVSHLNAVQNSDALREVYQRCIAKLTEYGSELGQDADLFRCYQALAAQPEFAAYSHAQQQWVNHALRDFRLSGIDLPAPQ